jgi:hypothetical protein
MYQRISIIPVTDIDNLPTKLSDRQSNVRMHYTLYTMRIQSKQVDQIEVLIPRRGEEEENNKHLQSTEHMDKINPKDAKNLQKTKQMKQT